MRSFSMDALVELLLWVENRPAEQSKSSREVGHRSELASWANKLSSDQHITFGLSLPERPKIWSQLLTGRRWLEIKNRVSAFTRRASAPFTFAVLLFAGRVPAGPRIITHQLTCPIFFFFVNYQLWSKKNWNDDQWASVKFDLESQIFVWFWKWLFEHFCVVSMW